jgi:tRNA (cytidine/uridine-2'-O-)-methyltransferase
MHRTIPALALYQPDIPQNTGTVMRMAACLGMAVHIIEPAGFPVTDRAFRRAGLDYLDQVTITRHASFEAFMGFCLQQSLRPVLVETTGATPLPAFAFTPADVLVLGRESAGVPPEVAARFQASLRIPMRAGLRSLNVAVAAALVTTEALRQTGTWPSSPD